MLSRMNKRQVFLQSYRMLISKNTASVRASLSLQAQPQANKSKSLSTNAAPTSSPTSFSHDKIETDERYASTAQVPESLLKKDLEDSDSATGEFSIRGKFRQGRAAYLDMSATTPMDPRVFDKMAPYMVR